MGNFNFQQLSKLLSECTKALGKALSDPHVQIAIGTTVAASVTTGIVVNQIDRQTIKEQDIKSEEKSRLYQEALAKQAAIINELNTRADMSNERQDYLVDLNRRLLEQIKLIKDGAEDE